MTASVQSEDVYLAIENTPKADNTVNNNKNNTLTEEKPRHYEQPNPLGKAGVLSILSVIWLQPLVSLGAKKILEKEDIWKICQEDSTEFLLQRFAQHYYQGGNKKIAYALAKTFWKEITVILINNTMYLAAMVLQPYLAQAILDYLNDKPNVFDINNGYVLVAILTGISFIGVNCLNYGFFISSRVGVNMRSIIMSVVYRKALKLSSQARQSYATGEIVTLMSVDAERICQGMITGAWIIVSPMAFLLTIILIAVLFDVASAMSGGALLVIIIFWSLRLADKIADAQIALYKFVEERVKVTSEALQGIRVMKFYAWEDSIAERVEKLRFQEIKLYRRFHFLQIINGNLLFMTPVFLGALVLGIYIAIKTTLSVTDAFILIALVNISRLAVSMFPIAVAGASQARIALHRVDKYLASIELTDHLALANRSLQLEKGSISVRGGTFSWSQRESNSSSPPQTHEATDTTPPTATVVTVPSSKVLTSGFQLHDIHVDIKPGSLVMIVGKVGSGKTSFLNALLNEMILEAGELSVNGEIAYVSQQAWIRNSTVKENILFESPFEAKRYTEVLDSTQLNLDMQALPNGDQTEIGEQGINLSGGQKARVSIARAMYRFNYDILILDDPLSAVDPHVAHAIFEQCIQGLAKEKTRLLVLNSHYDLLPHADQVLVIEDGTIVGNGTYAEVLTSFPDLSQEKKVQEAEEEDIIDEHVEEGEETQGEEKKSASTPPQNAQIQEGDEKKGETLKQVKDPVENNNNKKGGLIQEEDRVKGKVSGSTYRNYFDETGYNGALVVFVVSALYGVSQGLRIFVDWWQGYWAKQMSQPEYDALRYGMWYLGFIVVCTILSLVRGFVLIEGCIRSSRNMHDELFRRVLSAPINRYFDVTPLGRILNRFSNDLDQVDAVLPQLWHALFVIGAVFLGSLIVCAITSYWIALSFLPMLGFFVVTGLYFKKTSREVKRLDGVSRTPIFNLFGETLNGLSTIRAFQMQPKFIELNKKSIDDNTTFYLTYWAAGRWLAIRLDWMSVAIILVVSLYLVIAKGSISPVLAGLSIVYSLSLTSMIQWVVRSVDMTDNAMTSVERLLHFRNIPVEDDGSNAEELDLTTWPSKGALRFENLQLRYRPELPLVLHGVDMDVAGGEKVGICGRTGAGKSSLMIALFRICEFDAGSVYIDGKNISKVKLPDLRRSLAIIPQDPVLYSGTLRDNLDPFHEYGDERIWSVLRQIHLADAVTKWGSGLEFQVSEKGGNLSVGQRQLMCIGRALLKDSKVVVLDEATANVDTATDNLIQETIKESLREKSVLIIAHRINTIMHCDKIAVMDAGRVAEFGSPADLLSKPESIFSSLAKRSGHQ